MIEEKKKEDLNVEKEITKLNFCKNELDLIKHKLKGCAIMNNINENKKTMEILNVIKKQMAEVCNESVKRKLADLEEDINNDFFTIVILGEFKRGKSTFVNALLGAKNSSNGCNSNNCNNKCVNVE